MGLGGFVLGSLKGMRRMMFQLSGFYYTLLWIVWVVLRGSGGRGSLRQLEVDEQLNVGGLILFWGLLNLVIVEWAPKPYSLIRLFAFMGLSLWDLGFRVLALVLLFTVVLSSCLGL